MNKASIRFAPDVLRRLGEELNPNPHRGILELVKNAYDADAKKCTITLSDTDRAGGSVLVTDDGDGMGDDAIIESWLVLGRSEKSVKQTTRLGRIPSGSKGLGRLAALRMGWIVHLETRPRSEPSSEYRLEIRWREFDRASHVEDVPLTIAAHSRQRGAKHGTTVVIEDLRHQLTRVEVKKLARELILLADPFGDTPQSFKPRLVAPEFADLEELVTARYFDDAEYHLSASIDQKGIAKASVKDWKGRKLFEATHDDLTAHRARTPYRCPKTEFQLWIFILDSETFASRQTTMSEVQEWLRAFGGVHLYQNNLRVSPYGDPGNDWLDLNLRRARSPEERPSTNTVIGRVVVHDNEELLVQKTDRSGFIETEAFTEIRAFCQDVMEWLSRRRMEVAVKRRAKDRAAALAREKPSKKTLDATIQKASGRIKDDLKKAAEAREREHTADIERLAKEIQLYRTLSTAGITAATFAHESSGNPIKVITHAINAIARRAKEALHQRYAELLGKPVQSITQATKGLAVLGAATLKLLAHEKRRRARVEIHDVIGKVLETFKPFTDDRVIKVETSFAKGKPYLRSSEAAIESIITNLLNNSITALELSDQKQRQIFLVTELVDSAVRIRMLDNGPGIVGVDKEDVWLPGVTTRLNGTGLGLTIVRDTALDLGGQVDANETSALGGAEFIVDLPILGK